MRPGHQGKEGTNTRISSETCYQERFLPSRLRFEDGIPTRVSLLMGMRYYHRFFHPRDDNLRDLLVASLPTLFLRLYLPKPTTYQLFFHPISLWHVHAHRPHRPTRTPPSIRGYSHLSGGSGGNVNDHLDAHSGRYDSPRYASTASSRGFECHLARPLAYYLLLRCTSTRHAPAWPAVILPSTEFQILV